MTSYIETDPQVGVLTAGKWCRESGGVIVCDQDTPILTETGDISGVTAGNGLTGTATSGAVTLNVGAGTGISVAADTLSFDTTWGDARYLTSFTEIGDISSVTAGTGLTGGGTTGDLTINAIAGNGISVAADSIAINPTYTQRRISSSCVVGESIRVINEDGTVTCEVDTDTNTNAATICGAGTFLNGDGTCDTVPVDTKLSEAEVDSYVSNNNGYLNSDIYVNTAGDTMSGDLEMEGRLEFAGGGYMYDNGTTLILGHD